MTSRAKRSFIMLGVLVSVIAACLGLETRHDNHLGWALLMSGVVFIAMGCIYLGTLSIRRDGKTRAADRSLWLPISGVLLISLITPLEYTLLPSVLPRSDLYQDIGLILFAGGLAFFLLSLVSNDPWKMNPRRSLPGDPHKLPALIRILFTPRSIGLLLYGLALAIGYSSWMGFLVILLLVLPGLFNRVHMMDQKA